MKAYRILGILLTGTLMLTSPVSALASDGVHDSVGYTDDSYYDVTPADENDVTTATEKENVATPAIVKKIKISGSTHLVAPGCKLQLSATVIPSTADNTDVEWVSSNKQFATVTKTGLVKVKKAGKGRTVVITCKSKDKSGAQASYHIAIMDTGVKKITLTPTTVSKNAKMIVSKSKNKVTVKPGTKIKFNAQVKFKGAGEGNKKLVWTSSNEKWATVDKTGVVKTYKAGNGHTVKITAKSTDGTNKKVVYSVKISNKSTKKTTK